MLSVFLCFCFINKYMIYRVFSGIIFSVTIILAAKNIPLPHKLRKPAAFTAAAVLFTAADCFFICIFRKTSAAETAALINELTENKAEAENFYPSFLHGIIGSIHGFLISAAEVLGRAAGSISDFFGTNAQTAAFVLTALAVSSVTVYLTESRRKTGDNKDIVGIWHSIGFIVKGALSDAFLVSPVGSLIIYGICAAFAVPYKTILCAALWILSYIPFAGITVSVIFGTLVLLVSVHPVKAVLFLVSSSAVFAALNIGKDILSEKMDKGALKNA